MSESKESSNVKLCGKCGIVKNLRLCFYKAGDRYQSKCKTCHNTNRKKPSNPNPNYVKRPTGFKKLSPEIREIIKYDIHVGVSIKNIASKYESVNYRSLLRWKHSGQITEYVETEEDE
jgi:hypothetical protein